MGISTIIAGIGLAVSATGVAVSYIGQQKAQHAQQAVLEQQQQIEAQRQRQMNLDAERRKREIVRQSIAQRAQAEAAAGASGALTGSGLSGAYGNISGRAGVSELAVGQNQEIGNKIFGLNEGILGSYRDAAAGAGLASLGAGIGTLGGAMLSNAGSIGKIGTFLTNQFKGFDSFSGPSDGIYA